MVLFLCWVLWARALRPRVLVHENVVGFDQALLRRLLGDLYDVVILRAQPSHVGFPFVERKRVYAILLLRGGVRMLADPSALYDQVLTNKKNNRPTPKTPATRGPRNRREESGGEISG